MTALVRTSTSPPVYHLLGSDTCHAIALISPPSNYDPSRALKAGLYPKTELTPDYPDPDCLTSIHEDLAEAYKSMAKVARMDREDNINVYLSHDVSMDVLFLPTRENGNVNEKDGFELVRMAGGIDKLKNLKARDRSVLTPLTYPP